MFKSLKKISHPSARELAKTAGFVLVTAAAASIVIFAVDTAAVFLVGLVV